MVREREEGPGQSLFALADLPLHDVSAFAAWCVAGWGPGVYRIQAYRNDKGKSKLASTGREVHATSKKKKKKIAPEAPTRPDGPWAIIAEEKRILAAREARLADREAQIETLKEGLHARTLQVIQEGHRATLELLTRFNGAPAAQLSPEASKEVADLRVKLAQFEERERMREKGSRRESREMVRYEEPEDDDEEEDEPSDLITRTVGKELAPTVSKAIEIVSEPAANALAEWLKKIAAPAASAG